MDKRRIVLRYVVAVVLSESLVFVILDPFYLQFLTTSRGIGLSGPQFAAVVALGGWVTFVLDYLTGALADKAGRRFCWSSSLIVYAGAMFWLAVSKSFAGALVMASMQGLSWALASGAKEAWLYDWVGEESTRQAMAKAKLWSVPVILAGTLAAAGLAKFGLRIPIAVSGAIVLAGGFLVATYPEDYGGRSRPLWHIMGTGFQQFWRSRVLKLLVLEEMLMTFPMWMTSAWWLTYLVKEWEVESRAAALSFGVVAVSSALSGLAVAAWKKAGYRELLLCPAAVMVLCHVGAAKASHWVTVVALMALCKAAEQVRVVGLVLIRNSEIAEERATVLSLLSTFGGLAWVLGPLAWGAVIGKVGLRWSFVGASTCALIAGFVIYEALRDRPVTASADPDCGNRAGPRSPTGGGAGY